MLVIRYFRVGKRNQPSFKIVVTDKKKSSTRGRFVEEVGFYNPVKKERVLNKDRAKYWLSVGAKPSPTVHNFLVSEKVIDAKKIAKHKIVKKEAEAEAKPVEAKKEEAPSVKEEKPEVEVKNEAPVVEAEAKEEKTE